MNMNLIRTAVGTAVAAGLVAAGPAASDVSGAPASHGSYGTYTAQFDHPQENPYFPLRPGTVYHYRVSDEGERLREKVTITGHTRTILGVPTVVVRDVLRRQ